MAPLRLGLVADGEFSDPRTNSGVARGILHGLASSPLLDVRFAASTRVLGLKRALIRVRTFDPRQEEWRRKANHSRLARIYRSHLRDERLRQSDEVDLVMHVRNVYEPTSTPYAAFIDTTSVQSGRWADWSRSAISSEIRNAEARYFGEAQVVFTAGELARDSVIHDYGVPANRVWAVGGGTNYLTAPAEHDYSRATSDGGRVLFVGLDGFRKGADVVVEAVRSLRQKGSDISATLVGPHAFPESDGIRVLKPVWDRTELSELFSSHDMFVFPARHEPYGLVVQEAMAHGLPVVVSGAGELPNIVADNVTGIVCPTGSVQEVAGALGVLMGRPQLAEALGRAGRERAYEQFSWDKVAERMTEHLPMY